MCRRPTNMEGVVSRTVNLEWQVFGTLIFIAEMFATRGALVIHEVVCGKNRVLMGCTPSFTLCSFDFGPHDASGEPKITGAFRNNSRHGRHGIAWFGNRR